MSVIAWDGKSLAADKRTVIGTLVRTTTKIFRVRNCLVGYSGDACSGEEMLHWFRKGAKPEDFPIWLRAEDMSVEMLVVDKSKTLLVYVGTPHPITLHDDCYAMGSGGDFALAAMYCGKNAEEAVEVACLLDSACGNGVDVLPFK